MKQFIPQAISAFLLTGTLITFNSVLAQPIEVTKTIATSQGTVSEFGPQSIFIKTEPGVKPIRYISGDTTNYVDEEGKPVSVATVKSGLPVTIYYTKVGDTLIASKIMVRKLATASAQPLETTETIITTSAGTISEFGKERILIKTETSPDPLSYAYSKTTTYTDEEGNPVSISTVKSGLPVTVYYTKVGDTLMVNKVIVRKTLVIPAPVIEEKKTTTTTTTTRK